MSIIYNMVIGGGFVPFSLQFYKIIFKIFLEIVA